MKRHLCILAVMLAFLGLQSHSARAQSDANWGWIFAQQDIRLVVTGAVVGGGAAAAYYGLRHGPIATRLPPGGAFAMTTVWCAGAFPIIGTLVVQRPLTTREVYVGLGSCVVPIIGGWLVEAAFRGQPWFEGVGAGKM